MSSSSSNTLPDFSVLAAKPPQRPVEKLPSRPSTSNYAAALEASQHSQPQVPSSESISNPTSSSDQTANAEVEGEVQSPTASWRPKPNRKQSWSAQEYKRAMQTPLMSPSAEKKTEYGFSSKEDVELGEEGGDSGKK